MKPFFRGATSGCLIWLILFCFLAFYLCTATSTIAVFSLPLTADPAAQLLEPYICPEHTTAELISFETTTRDEFGNESPTTSYELHCVDEGGDVVKEATTDYVFYWIGIVVASSLGIAAILSLLVSLPMAVLIAQYAWRHQED